MNNDQKFEIKIQEYQRQWYHLNKAKKLAYTQRPDVKAKKRAYNQRWYQENKAKIQEQVKLQDDYCFSSKQNSEFNLSFAADGRYDEQTIKTAWNMLEPEQLNLLNWMGYTLLDTNYVDKWTN